MLCGTAVIGSGARGMRELLIKGEQIICNDYSKLKPTVTNLSKDKQKLNSFILKRKKVC
jgi:hypothetical protein